MASKGVRLFRLDRAQTDVLVRALRTAIFQNGDDHEVAAYVADVLRFHLARPTDVLHVEFGTAYEEADRG